MTKLPLPYISADLPDVMANAYDGYRYYLSVEEAMEFHFPTVRTLAQSGADYLFAGIMPQLTEAIGMAQCHGCNRTALHHQLHGMS